MVGVRRRARAALAVLLGVALVAEVGARVAAPHLPSPLEWSSDEAQVKYEDLRDGFATSPGGVVFVGSSLVDAAIDPAIVSERVDGNPPAYNAALLGSPMRMIELWTTKAVVPLARPSVVVVGVSCREVNGAESEQQEITQEFEASPAMRRLLGRETALDRVARQAFRASYLIRYRTVLRQPRNFVGRDRRSGHLLKVSPRGMNTAMEDGHYPPPDEVTKVLFPGAITRFRLSEGALHSLQRLVRTLRGGKTQVLVVNMPVTEDFVSWMPNGSRDHAACVRAIGQAAEDAGAAYLDAGVWDRELFTDPIHVNRAGADRVSARIAVAVAELAARGRAS